MSKSYFDKTLNSKVFYREPLFLVKLDLEPEKSDEVKGGGSFLYNKLKKNISLRREFIKALHLSTEDSWRILRNAFFTKEAPQMDNSKLSYTYLDSDAGKFIGDCEVIDFPLVDVSNINDTAKTVYEKASKCVVVKTHAITDENLDLINFWYECLELTTNFENELQTWKNAGFTVKEQYQPDDSNPLHIQYIKLVK